MTLETLVPAKLQKIENLMNRAYAVVLEPAEEGGFIVRVPAIPESSSMRTPKGPKRFALSQHEKPKRVNGDGMKKTHKITLNNDKNRWSLSKQKRRIHEVGGEAIISIPFAHKVQAYDASKSASIVILAGKKSKASSGEFCSGNKHLRKAVIGVRGPQGPRGTKEQAYYFSKGKRGPVLPQAGKTRITMWIDTDVLNAFREAAERECKGYQMTINEALRAAAFREEAGSNTTELENRIQERVRAVVHEELAHLLVS